jgi:hypothetical protein
MRLAEESSEAQAILIQQTYAIGSYITVHFNPERPGDCVTVYDEVPAGSWIVPVCFIGIGLFIVVITVCQTYIKN